MSLKTFAMTQGSFETPDAITYLRNVLNALWTKGVIASIKKLAADSLAADTTAETLIPRQEIAGTVTAVYLKAESGTLTAANTDTATVNVYKRAAAGGTQVLIATLVSNVAGGNWTQWVKKSLTLSVVAGATTLLLDDSITFEITKQAIGKITPSFTLVVVVEPTVPTT